MTTTPNSDLTSDSDLTQFDASTAAALIRAGKLTSVTLVEACLARIAERDEAVQAWSWLDAESALAAARLADAAAPSGPLHGVPVGLKDVIDAAGLPTEFGSEAFVGNRPAVDAGVTARLRAAGAIILGKLVTAEFATYRPGPTRNPANPAHTPGGSSSGSAAAVADRQVPLALGTQTAGSVVRPASFCGAVGFKPSIGRYPTTGVIETSHRLDTIGTFSRSVADAALADRVLSGDPTRAPAPSRPLVIGVLADGMWAAASSAMQDTLRRHADAFAAAGHQVFDRPSPAILEELAAAQKLIHHVECSRLLADVRRIHADRVSPQFIAFVDEGAATSEAAYAEACRVQDRARSMADDLFGGADLLLAASALGTAPAGLASTGDPVFCRPWTALGVPTLGFPAGAADGLPLGLQLIGREGRDPLLLAQAAHLLGEVLA